MATKKKMLQAAAGQAGGACLDITDVFSTYLYSGTSGSPGTTVTNGIDLAGEGGLVWLKSRSNSVNHSLFDTERGGNSNLATNVTDGSGSLQMDVFGGTVFNSDGFFLRSGNGTIEASGYDYASWTFRKAPKFFTCVTYTGTGDTTTQTISHNLGAVPGCIIVKRTDSPDSWRVYHRGVDVNGDGQPWTDMLTLNTTAAASDFPVWGDTAPTSTEFTVGYESSVNGSGGTYVAYVFAHNDGDGEFGPDGDQDVIKCGSFPWGSTSGTEVNLGFEPQWILFKAADQAGKDWFIFDAMRGIVTGGFSGDGDAALFPNTSGAENVNTWGVDLTPTGFIAYGNNIASSGNIIYMAIRRGPLAQPESGTDVFAPNLASGYPRYPSGFTTDFVIQKNRSSGSSAAYSRLQGNDNLNPTSTAQESASAWDWAQMTGSGTNFTSTGYIGWSWKRAPSFCDVVAYSGDGVRGRTVSHNLGVVPEMMWIKNRDDAQQWLVYIDSLGGTQKLYLSSASAIITASIDDFNNTNAEATQFTLGNDGRCNANNQDYIAYLFATLPGVSKVGSYTGNGTSQTIDCGFTSGARFVLLKNASSIDDWRVFDTARGIVAGNDPMLYLNSTEAEETGGDYIDPQNSGFSLTSNSSVNASGDTYIFYAIA